MADHIKNDATKKIQKQNGISSLVVHHKQVVDDGTSDDDDNDINGTFTISSRPITRLSVQRSQLSLSINNLNRHENNSEKSHDDGSEVDDDDDDDGDDDDDWETVKRSKKNPTDDDDDDAYYEEHNRPQRPSLHRKKSNIDIESLLSENIEYESQSLYVRLLKRKQPIKSIIQDWIRVYNENSELALLQFVQLVVNASSCKEKVTKTIISMQQTDIDLMLMVGFESLDNGYPLIRSGYHWKAFCKNLATFIHDLVELSKETIICGGVLFEFIISELISFSYSGLRPFRHTATFMALNLLTALNKCMNCLFMEVRETTIDGDDDDDDDELQLERNIQLKRIGEIHCMIDYLFVVIFLERYRDTLPEIRLICIKEISLWIQQSPDIFLHSGHLKHIGYTLTDAVYSVRFGCVQTILQLYENQKCLEKLDKFAERFHTQLFSMMLNEKETGIIVIIIKILGIILKNIANVLTEQHCDIINSMVFVKNRKIAQASGEFLIQSICQLSKKKNHLNHGAGGGNVAIAEHLSRTSLYDATDLFKKLMKFYYTSNLPNHMPYFVDSLIDDFELIKKWPVFIDCLRSLSMTDNDDDGDGGAEESFDSNLELPIIKCLLCAIHQYATGEIPKGRYSNSKISLLKETTNKDKKLIDKVKLTEYFIDELPDLLKTYKFDVEKLTLLLKIPQYMNFNGFQIGTSQNLIQPLLKQMMELIDCHWMSMVLLDTFSMSLKHLCDPNSMKFKWCNEFLNEIIKYYCNEYNESIENWKITNLQPNIIDSNDAEQPKFILKLKRSTSIITALYKYHNLNEFIEIFKNFYESIQEFLKRLCNETDSLFPVEAIAKCIETCLLVFIWKLRELKENLGDGDDGGRVTIPTIETDCNELSQSINEFMNISFDLLQTNDGVIQNMAFKAINEMLQEFNKYKIDEKLNPIMKLLIFPITTEHLTILNDYIQKFVFIKMNSTVNSSNANEINDAIVVDHIDHGVLNNDKPTEDRRRLCLIEYCTLIANGFLASNAAVNVFQHYITFQNEYGDIIKEFIKKLRLTNKLNCALAMLLTLINQFKDMQQQLLNGTGTGGDSRNKIRILKNSSEFIQLRQLAKRFVQTFSSNLQQCSETMLKLHQYGISFAVKNNQEKSTKTSSASSSSSRELSRDNVVLDDDQTTPAVYESVHHPNILFLSILSEFSSKLGNADKKKILNYLEYIVRSCSSSAFRPSIICQPYILYVDSLLSE